MAQIGLKCAFCGHKQVWKLQNVRAMVGSRQDTSNQKSNGSTLLLIGMTSSFVPLKLRPCDIHNKASVRNSKNHRNICWEIQKSSQRNTITHPTIIPDICRPRHPRRGCKNFKVRGIFSIFNTKGTPVEYCRMCVI